ncbi:hypothetical protein TYRP_005441 [Tyrophagus putrescentiae]|nr:hypothetical protein TYRP_005441 [Tyrophagus putrescentiae]
MPSPLKFARAILNSAFYYSTVQQMYEFHDPAEQADRKGGIKRYIVAYYRLFYAYCLLVSGRMLLFGTIGRLRDNREELELMASVDLPVAALLQMGIHDGNVLIFASPDSPLWPALPLLHLLPAAREADFEMLNSCRTRRWTAPEWAEVVKLLQKIASPFFGRKLSEESLLFEARDRLRAFLGARRTTGGFVILGPGSRGERRGSVLVDLNVNPKLEFFPEIAHETRLKLRQLVEFFLVMQLGTYGVITVSVTFLIFSIDYPTYRFYPLFILAFIDLLLAISTIVNIMKVCTFALFNLAITCRFALLELKGQLAAISEVARTSGRLSHFTLARNAAQFRHTKMPTALFAVFFLSNFFFNVYTFTFLYYNVYKLPRSAFVIGVLLLGFQTLGSFGSAVPIVVLNTSLCYPYPKLFRLQLALKNVHFIGGKWKLASYTEMIDPLNEYLAPRIEAFHQLTKESLLKFSLFYIAYLIFFCGKFVETENG